MIIIIVIWTDAAARVSWMIWYWCGSTPAAQAYPHPLIPAAWLFFVVLLFLRFLSPGEILKSGMGICFRAPSASF